jgi:uncharacterized repeat protein (TIGR02543 family)
MNKTEKKLPWKAALMLLTGLLLFGGCEGLFHPKQTEEDPPPVSSAPSEPAGVSAYTISSSSIGISWESVSGAIGYNIYRASWSDGPYSYISWTNITSHTDTGLSSNTTYYYKVSAYNDYREGFLSNYGYATTGESVTSLPDNLSLNEALMWISDNAVDGDEYIITLKNNEYLEPKILSYEGKNIGITINGESTERTISLSSSGSLFTVESGVTLTLGSNVTLLGREYNTDTLVRVNSEGALVMNDGSKITGNMNYVYSSGEHAYVYGSGVYVSGGILTIDGGEISGNTAYAESASSYAGVWGGGVYIGSGVVTLNKGKISGNIAKISGSSGSFINGAGIDMNTGEFTMNGGEISGNIVESSQFNGYFSGGGIYFCYGTLTLNGGKITGNGSSDLPGFGGGVFFGYNNDTFIINGGEISDNTASDGGGIYVQNGNFVKQTGGIIYGANSSDALRNTATNGNGYGHAVYTTNGRIRNTTAGSGVTLNSSIDGTAGGWETGEELQCTVTFDADGGSPATQTRTINSGDSIGDSNMPDTPTKGGYDFDGWHTLTDGEGAEFTAAATVTEDITVYAKWTIAQYTVTFDANGGSPAIETRTVSSGAWIGDFDMPDNPTKGGYGFDGWHTDVDDSSTEFTAYTTVTEDLRVYAKWTITQYTVTFDADGGIPATENRTVNSGASIGVSNMPTTPTKDGYGFDGWYTLNNGGGTRFIATTLVTGDITVYAKWLEQYTVTFDADGGIPATQTKTVNDGASIGASNMPDNPAKTGYTFDGWYTSTGGGGTRFTVTTTVTTDITVYAKWLDQYTVTFDADGGNPAIEIRTVADGSSVGASYMPANPTKSGYGFGGWYTATSGGGTEFSSTTTVTGNITVYANWTVMPTTSLAAALNWLALGAEDGNEYTITLNANETIAPRTLSYNGKQVGITIKGNTSERRVVLNSNGSLFTVESGVTLTLDNNITLQGRSNNENSLVTVNGGTLVMNTGSKITGNATNRGGGVRVYNNGTFTLDGGEISGNSASSSYNNPGGGGGVYVDSGMFTMSGGKISGNSASSSSNYSGGGGGVHVNSGMFTMSGGEISGNSASSSSGGGVYVATAGMFTMDGGEISGNSSSSHGGGGVYVEYGGTFMKLPDATSYGSNASNALKNTAYNDDLGHAVYIYNGYPGIKRNTTAGTGVTLNSAVSGSAGGWE